MCLKTLPTLTSEGIEAGKTVLQKKGIVTCITLCFLFPVKREEQHLTTNHISLQDSVQVQSVYSWFLPTRSFWLY